MARKIQPKQIEISNDNTLGGLSPSERVLPSQKAIKEYIDSNDANNNFTATTDPTVNDDDTQDYSLGSIWYNTNTGSLFVAVDVTTGAAVWVRYNEAPSRSTSDKGLTASTTTADGQLATASTVTDVPYPGSEMAVYVNGIRVSVGSGEECYFSPDNIVIRGIGDVEQGDSLYWNGSIAGYQLNAANYTIDLEYETL